MEADVEFFEKKIRPILVTHCISCHGEQKQKGGLRLDSRELALKGGDTGPAFVAKMADKSLLVHVVEYTSEIKMPPKGKLADDEINALKQWVNAGAVWPKSGGSVGKGPPEQFDINKLAQHWSFQPVKPVAVPSVKAANPIDSFIQEKLAAQKLTIAQQADKRTLIRRVTLDLIGLPPTPAEVDAFVQDQSPQAWEKLLERLLASPRYGERIGRHWLDLVRYAETLGHEFDFELYEPWRYRDYVIRAFNDDVPYNQFLKEHLAGDLLPNPRRHPIDKTNESVLATAFWYLGEAKHSPVDVRQDQADRMDNSIDVFAKTFLGLTISCARCHDHKFDAISTKDYYALYGILSSSRHDKPFIDDASERAKVLTPLQTAATQWEQLARKRVANQVSRVLKEKGLSGFADGSPEWKRLRDLSQANPEAFTKTVQAMTAEHTKQRLAHANWEKTAKPIRMDRDWVATGESFAPYTPTFTPDERGSGTITPPALTKKPISTKLAGTYRSATFTIDRDFLMYRTSGNDVRVNLVIDNFQLIQDPIYGSLRFGVNGDGNRWHTQHVSRWKGHRAYVEFLDDGNGQATIHEVLAVDQPTPPPLQPNAFTQQLISQANSAAFTKEATTILLAAVAKFSEMKPLNGDEIQLLNWAFSSSSVQSPKSAVENAVQQQFIAAEKSFVPARRAMGITDGTPLNERVFIRGNHKSLGDDVPRRLLEGIDPKPYSQGSGRLEMAERLTNGQHPLTARVFVNRIWKQHFGEGLVRTPDDFGHQGQVPTHPELLDWLATWFINNDWSVKKLHRLILTSAVYQQSSVSDSASDEADPKNELLHKMPIRRLEAEAIRDSLLAISGRLDVTMGGPSIPVYLTPFMQGRGRPGGSGPLDGAGRRSVYQQVRRNFLNPFFMAFDYPVPFTAIGKRTTSNVPAQALAMLNNPFVNQQTELWAKRIIAEKGTTEERINKMYQQAFARPATPKELAAAKEYIGVQLTEHGPTEEPRVWADLAHVLVNVKEFIFVK